MLRLVDWLGSAADYRLPTAALKYKDQVLTCAPSLCGFL